MPEATETPATEEEGLFAQARARLNSGWQQAALMLSNETQHGDLLVGKGNPFVVYSPRLPLRHRAATQVRFLLGDELLATGDVSGSGRAYAVASTKLEGTHTLCWQPLNKDGEVLWRKPKPFAAVQVCGASEALLAVDCRWLLDDLATTQKIVHSMIEQGWQPVWVSTADEDREGELLKALKKSRLPKAAFLQWPEPEREFPSLGLDFRGSLLKTRFLRLRGEGVQLAGILSHQPSWEKAAKTLNLPVFHPDELTEANWPAPEVPTKIPVSRTISERINRINNTPRSSMTNSHIEFNNQKARKRLLELIDSAQSEILIQTYILKNGPFAQWLALALTAAARRGVQVRLLVDALYSTENLLGRRNTILALLDAEPNIQAIAADRIEELGALGMPELKHRNHRKLILIDHKIAIVSGRNIGDEYYTGFEEVPIADWTPAEAIPWLDAHIEFAGPLVTPAHELFVESWLRNGGEELPAIEFAKSESANNNSVSARLISDEGEGDTACLLVYQAMIDAAQSELILVNNFPVVASLASAIRCALARGVRVRFLTGCGLARREDGSMFDGSIAREAFEYLAKKRFEPLMLDGAEIYEYRVGPLPNIISQGGRIRPYVHAKVVCADGQVASIGSANLDSTASYWEREANVLIEDEGVVTALQNQIIELMDQSHRIDTRSDYWLAETGRRELANRLYPEGLV